MMYTTESVVKNQSVFLAKFANALSARAFSLFLAIFTLMNILLGIRHPGFDANGWWIDLRPMPRGLSEAGLAVAAMCLLGYGLTGRFRNTAFWICAVLTAVAMANSVTYTRLRLSGVVYSGSIISFSMILAVVLFLVTLSLHKETSSVLSRRGRWLTAFATLGCFMVFPGLQILCFGSTDYRRPADIAVVFGTKAYGNRPSVRLDDRVRTACELYQQGLVPRLLLSGGPSGGGWSEVDAMRWSAHRYGVSDSAIIADTRGLSTADTVRNSIPIFRHLHARRVIAVSQDTHMPRIKLCYQRSGWNVFTVPVSHPRMSRTEYPHHMARETLAFWGYCLLGKQPEAKQ